MELGYQILAVSPDRPEKGRAIVAKTDIEYTLLSDPKLKAARAMGVAYKVDDETYDAYKNKLGADLEERSGERHHLLPVPSVFLLDTEGVIRFEYVNPNYRIRIPPEVLLAAARTALEGEE